MKRARAQTNRSVHLQRDFERSRLEADLVATAYELAVPVQRRPSTTAQQRAADSSRSPQSSPLTGGFSA